MKRCSYSDEPVNCFATSKIDLSMLKCQNILNWINNKNSIDNSRRKW